MPIKPSIAAKLLGRAAARDNRTPTEAGALAWAEDLDDQVTLEDGAAAISAHYTRTRDFIMPADINTEVRRIRKIRTDTIGDVVPPGELADFPMREMAWKREYARAIGDGETPDAATKRACDALGVTVPLAIEPIPRPEDVRRLMSAHGPQCECGCLTKHVRPEEGAE